MKNLSQHINEALKKSSILEYNYAVFPYQWKKFVEIVKSSKYKLSVGKDDGDEIVHDGKEIIAKYDDDFKVYTSIPKAAFFLAVLHKDESQLLAHFKK